MFKLLSRATLLVLCSNTYGAEFTLNNLIQMGKENNFSLKSQKYLNQDIGLDVESAKSNFLPKLGVTVTGDYSRETDSGEKEDSLYRFVHGELNLFNGFKDYDSLEKKENILRKNEELSDKKEFNLTLSIEGLYYQLSFLKQKRSLVEEVLVRTNSHLQLLTRRVKSQLITGTDLLEFEIYKKGLLAEKSFLSLEIKKTFLDLQKMIGVKKNFQISKEKLPHYQILVSKDEVIKKKHSSLDSLKLNIQKEMIQVGKIDALSSFYPKVNLRVEHGVLDLDNDFEGNNSRLLVEMKFNLFSKKQDSIALQKKNISLQLNEINSKRIEYDSNLEIENIYNQLKILEDMIDFEEKNRKLIENLYSATLREYKKGVKDSGALKASSDQLYSSNKKVSELKMNYILSKLKMEKLVGYQLAFKIIRHR